jgi:hypothetical protein
MRQLYRSVFIAFSLAAATAAFAQGADNPARRSTGDVFNFGGAPLRTQESILASGGSVFADPNVANGITRGARTGTTHITPVPEPSQWAMMLAGLGLVGFIVRRNAKRKKDD